MKTTKFHRRAVSAILALLLLLPVIPTAEAATYKCKACGKNCDYTVLKEATCQEEGVDEYICTNSRCELHDDPILVKTAVNPANHITVCTDNGDGLTHSATCRVCTTYRDIKENHSFENGYCTKCSAADYAQAEISMPSSIELYVALNDAQATLSIGEIAMKVGNIDVSDSYNFSFGWMDQNGTTVGNSATYQLPAAITAKEGDYSYGCFVVAMPKGITSGKFVSKSCTVTVHVRDLVMSTATVNADTPSFLLGTTNNRTPVSVADQIYQATYKLSSAYPSYVVFGTKPLSTIADLSVNSAPYYFAPTTGQQNLSHVLFTPINTAAGTYVINYTVYDTAGKSFPGVLTLVVEKNLGTLDVSYITTQGVPVKLSSAEFTAFWQKNYNTGFTNIIVNFKSLPTVREGVLYYNYSALSLTNVPVAVTDTFYTVPVNTAQKLLDGLTFVPDAKFTGLVSIPFDMYGVNTMGQYTPLSGKLSIFVSSGSVRDVSYTINSGTALNLSAADFLTVHQYTTGSTNTNFSIRLLDVPQNGALYVDYTGTALDKPLTAATISDFTFYYSSTLSKEISDLTYTCPKSTTKTTDTIRYVVCDSKGEFEYVGAISIAAKASIVIYTKYFSDVTKSDWFYDEVMTLAEAGIINGMTTTTFEPNGEVTYGQALKLIMMAAGYPNIAPTGTHWASGFLATAKIDGLVNVVLTENYLDRKIDRNTIAQIAYKALKLPVSTLTTSPFTDVLAGSTYAPYVFALYEAGIITGSDNLQGEKVFYGVNSIRRSEMAAIVLRMNEYKNS